jgi:glycosyltransferase involved in cell wall biosynthesis
MEYGRILYTSLVDLSIPYGPGVNERGFAKDMLRRFGTDLHAVVPRPLKGLPEELAALDATFLPRGATIRSLHGWLLAGSAAFSMLPRAIAGFQPDLVVVRTGALALGHLRATSGLNVPYVLKTAGDVTFRSFYGRSPVRRVTRPVNDFMFHRLLHGAMCVDVVSSAQRQRALALYPELETRVHVIDNGVDLQHFTPGARDASRRRLGFSSDEFVVGYVGNLPMRRGGREVIDVVADLVPRFKARGLIVGDTGEAAACRDYADRRGVADAVVVYGEADYGEVPALMGAMDVGLSILRSHERGNSEQKVRQYLAMGLCVVGTAGSNDFLRGEDFSRIVATEEPGPIIEAVKSLAELPASARAEYGREARRLAQTSLSIAARNQERLDLWQAMEPPPRV